MNKQILVELQEYMGSDRAIANAAWTSSFNKERREDMTVEKVNKVVHMLARDGHATPFESVVLRFWIRMPIMTDRQHMTHRIASHNGLSGRYRTMPLDYFKVPSDVEAIFIKANPDKQYAPLEFLYRQSCDLAVQNYSTTIECLKKAESNGIITNAEFKRAREIARGQLPTAGMVERTTIMNLRSFANYQKLRNSEHAQSEIRQVAQLMLKEVEDAQIAPVAIEALKLKGWNL